MDRMLRIITLNLGVQTFRFGRMHRIIAFRFNPDYPVYPCNPVQKEDGLNRI